MKKVTDYYWIYTIEWDDPNYPLSPTGSHFPQYSLFLEFPHDEDAEVCKEDIAKALADFYFDEIHPISFRFRRSSLEEKNSSEYLKTLQLLRPHNR